MGQIRRMAPKVLALVNATGRQAASVARCAAALGYHVRAHVHQLDHLVAIELGQIDNVELLEGRLEDDTFVQTIFHNAQYAFINTVSFGDEYRIGCRLADAAKYAGVQHYIYSSMPDHAIYDPSCPSLPHWSVKFAVEKYIRQIDMPATFVYAGIYNNNFTSLPYPLFCMKLQANGSFTWKAPFHPHAPLPWLDAEHDVGPTVMQIFKDGPNGRSNKRIALAFELLSPTRVCELFARALNRSVTYIHNPRIDIEVSIPAGYREQLQGIEIVFGTHNAAYFGSELEHGRQRREVEGSQDDGAGTSVAHARALWQGWRGIEEYAREVFPIEEATNGLSWMKS